MSKEPTNEEIKSKSIELINSSKTYLLVAENESGEGAHLLGYQCGIDFKLKVLESLKRSIIDSLSRLSIESSPEEIIH